ncbi:MAG: hypothetical protein M1821_003055 [Bathelium mastoideum]|nr:MAG: hypothetical protein M1821_003055 [Bathelium mastoideum]
MQHQATQTDMTLPMQSLDSNVLQQLMLATQKQIDDLQKSINKRFDVLKQKLVPSPPRTPDGSKPLESPLDSGYRSINTCDVATDKLNADPFVDAPSCDNGNASDEMVEKLKLTTPNQATNFEVVETMNAGEGNNVMASPLGDRGISVKDPIAAVEFGAEFFDENSPPEAYQLEETMSVADDAIHVSPKDAQFLKLTPDDHYLDASSHGQKSEEQATLTRDLALEGVQAMDMAPNVSIVGSPNIETEALSDDHMPNLANGGSQPTFCDSPFQDPTMPQNRPNRDDHCYGATYYALVHGKSQSEATDTTKESESPQSTDSTMPQHRPEKDDLCYGKAYKALIYNSTISKTNDAVDVHTAAEDPTMPQNRSEKDDLCYGLAYHALVHGTTTTNLQDEAEGGSSLANPSDSCRSIQDAHGGIEETVPLSIKISENIPNHFDGDMKKTDAANEPSGPESPQFEASSGSSRAHSISETEAATPLTSASDLDEPCCEDQKVNGPDEGKLDTCALKSAMSTTDHFALQSQPLMPQEEALEFIVKELGAISQNSKLSPLTIIQQSLATLFHHENDLASELFEAITVASSCRQVSGTGKIDVYPTQDAGVGIIAWDSPINAAILPLLLATKITSQVGAHLDTPMTDSLELFELEDTRVILQETRATPSASLSTAFRAAQKDARSHNKTTLLSVCLVDTYHLELSHSGRHATNDCHTSFGHNFVLGLGPEGCTLWQSWGEGKQLRDRHGSTAHIPGAFGFDEWITKGGANVKDWKEMEEWVRSFEKLVKLKGATWTNQHNKLYKRCFGPDLVRLCYPQGKLLGLVPKFKPWVKVEVMKDVTAKDVTKFEFHM